MLTIPGQYRASGQRSGGSRSRVAEKPPGFVLRHRNAQAAEMVPHRDDGDLAIQQLWRAGAGRFLGSVTLVANCVRIATPPCRVAGSGAPKRVRYPTPQGPARRLGT